MTRKSIEKQVDGLIDQVVRFKGLDPRPNVKGGEAELANGAVYTAIRKLTPQILAECGVVTAPTVAATPADDADAA